MLKTEETFKVTLPFTRDKLEQILENRLAQGMKLDDFYIISPGEIDDFVEINLRLRLPEFSQKESEFYQERIEQQIIIDHRMPVFIFKDALRPRLVNGKIAGRKHGDRSRIANERGRIRLH
jgi:hypothetical protein